MEASPALSDCQERALLPRSATNTTDLSSGSPYKSINVDGVDVHWYLRLEDVPRGKEEGEEGTYTHTLSINLCCSYLQTGLSYFIAHEFLDALPIHQFQVCKYSGTSDKGFSKKRTAFLEGHSF